VVLKGDVGGRCRETENHTQGTKRKEGTLLKKKERRLGHCHELLTRSKVTQKQKKQTHRWEMGGGGKKVMMEIGK